MGVGISAYIVVANVFIINFFVALHLTLRR